mgnify:CR=1 FL=1
MEVNMPANKPMRADPDTNAAAPAANAEASIFPSRPISNIPALSEKSPARQANKSGMLYLTDISKTCSMVSKSIRRPPLPS